MRSAILTNLAARTGRTLEEWVQLLHTTAPASRAHAASTLVDDYGLGALTADIIVGAAFPTAASARHLPGERLAQLFAGRPAAEAVWRQLAIRLEALGGDVAGEVQPDGIALSRARPFAFVAPLAANGGLDLGLMLAATAPTPRLRRAERLGAATVTHALTLQLPAEIDREVAHWLRAAYERAR